MGSRGSLQMAVGSAAGSFPICVVDGRKGMMLHEVSDLLLDARVVHEKAMQAGDLQEVGHPFQFGFLDRNDKIACTLHQRILRDAGIQFASDHREWKRGRR